MFDKMADYVYITVDISKLECSKNKLWLNIAFNEMVLPISIKDNVLVLDIFIGGLICQDCIILEKCFINDHNIFDIPSALLLHLIVDCGITIETHSKDGITRITKKDNEYFINFKITENNGKFTTIYNYELTFDDYYIGSFTDIYKLPDMFDEIDL